MSKTNQRNITAVLLNDSGLQYVRKNVIEPYRSIAEQDGFDVNYFNRNGETALILAIKLEHISFLKFLVDTYASQLEFDTQVNKKFPTPLAYAMKKKNQKAIQLLMGVTNLKTKPTKKDTYLTLAILYKQDIVIDYMIDKKILLNEGNSEGSVPLLIAIRKGYLDVAIKLLKVKGEAKAVTNIPNRIGDSPFLEAINCGYFNLTIDGSDNELPPINAELLKLFCESKTLDINYRHSGSGLSALFSALFQKNFRLVHHLLDTFRLKINVDILYENYSMLGHIISKINNISDDHYSIATKLIEYGTDINIYKGTQIDDPYIESAIKRKDVRIFSSMLQTGEIDP